MNKKSILISVIIIIIASLIFYIIATKKAQAPIINTTDTEKPASLLNKKYIRSVDDWPPQVKYSKRAFSCVEGGNDIETKGVIINKVINKHTYCVIIAKEGAAGSTYTTYTYNTEVGGQLANVSFILQTVQCMNYDEPEQTECKNEQSSFNTDLIVDSLIFDK